MESHYSLYQNENLDLTSFSLKYLPKCALKRLKRSGLARHRYFFRGRVISPQPKLQPGGPFFLLRFPSLVWLQCQCYWVPSTEVWNYSFSIPCDLLPYRLAGKDFRGGPGTKFLIFWGLFFVFSISFPHKALNESIYLLSDRLLWLWHDQLWYDQSLH